MNSQLYIAASGLLVEERRLELIANNLANLSTAGFRAQRAFSTVYRASADMAGPLPHAANQAVALAGVYEVPGPGPAFSTGRQLDVALDDGLLAVETPAGRRYTRAGTLDVSREGRLIDGAGRAVLDANGRPIDGLTAAAGITADGRVVERDAERGRLLVVRDPAKVLRPEGGNLLGADGRDAQLETVAQPALQPGWLESSATVALSELVSLIDAQRAFESYQKIVSTTMNEVNRKAVTEIAG
jgi:flagellar basal body rod protein FlgG